MLSGDAEHVNENLANQIQQQSQIFQCGQWIQFNIIFLIELSQSQIC